MSEDQRTYLVTGSASGIGLATAKRLTSEGHRVIGVDLHDADILADLATEEGRRTLVDQATALTSGRLDGVAAVAGISAATPTTVGVNYFGAVATLRGLRPLLLTSEAPRAVAVSSMSSLQPSDPELIDLLLTGDEAGSLERAGQLAASGPVVGAQIYASTKTALSRWLRQVAPTDEWAGAGIPLNAIAPGVVLTPMTEYLRTSPEALDQLLELVPMPLHGPLEPEACASLINWLLDVENTHLCGQVVFIDGGYDVVTRGDATW